MHCSEYGDGGLVGAARVGVACNKQKLGSRKAIVPRHARLLLERVDVAQREHHAAVLHHGAHHLSSVHAVVAAVQLLGDLEVVRGLPRRKLVQQVGAHLRVLARARTPLADQRVPQHLKQRLLGHRVDGVDHGAAPVVVRGRRRDDDKHGKLLPDDRNHKDLLQLLAAEHGLVPHHKLRSLAAQPVRRVLVACDNPSRQQ